MRRHPMRVLNVRGNSKNIPIPPHYAGWEHLLLDIDPRGKPDVVRDARDLGALPASQFDAIAQLAKPVGLVRSTSKALRLIAQNDINVDGDVVAQNVTITTGNTVVVQAGKRKFARVQVA